MKLNALYSAMVLSLVAGAAHAIDDPQGKTVDYDQIKVTAGGFIEAAGIYRNVNQGADIGSSWAGIPYSNSNADHLSQVAMSARQSRLSLLVQGPERNGGKAEAYFESDFLGAAPTANSRESNSYTPRTRAVYLDYTTNDGWQFLAGQNWSLLTPNTQGIGVRKELIPLTIDAQYVPGFNWTRNAQFRVVKKFNNAVSAGVSLENPQALIGNGSGCQSTGGLNAIVPANCAVTTTVPGAVNNYGGTPYSVDRLPDTIAKFAFDPGYGHYEVYGMFRQFRDRSDATPGSGLTGVNKTVNAPTFGANMILPIVPKYLDLQASYMNGKGNGRYMSSQLNDVVFNSGSGDLHALKGESAMVGLVAHPDSNWDLYAYGGFDKITGSGVNGVYGDGAVASNAACETAGLSYSACSAQVKQVKQLTVGSWYKFYQGNVGLMKAGLQFAHTTQDAFADKVGNAPSAGMNELLVSLRYYPWQK